MVPLKKKWLLNLFVLNYELLSFVAVWRDVLSIIAQPGVLSQAYVNYVTLLKINVLHDDREEPFCLNGSIKSLSVSQNILCGERRFFRL